MENIKDEAAYSMPVLEMLKVANEYCLFLENQDKYTLEDSYLILHRMLPLMYLKGSLLPEIEVDNTEANERFLTEVEWETMFTMLQEKYINVDLYWHLDFFAEDPENPVTISISEQLTDTYQDLKDFLILYQRNSKDAKQNAAQNIRNLFFINWGPKCINLQKQIHYLLFKDVQPEQESDFF